MEFTISTGKSRHELRWHIERVSWDELVQRLKRTHRTAETVADYKKATKDRRSEIKDVGGFVGGAIHGGRRKRGSVQKRSMLTLDADFATMTLWDDFTGHYDCAAVLYSTHSHTPESPRYRLIVPLKREVGVDEYEAIARRVAETLGIDQFDDTTYQAERLMYWPSTSADGEFVCLEQEGKPMDADAVLATYDDWHDVSQWPVSSRQADIVRRELKKQGDPLTKPGAIGLFCRAYTIQDAIAAYLSEEYEPTTDDNRYTYRQGSTAAGLVVYEDKFAYSHHNTDPCSGKLVNAFDLVRIHLYGAQDDEVKAGTPNNRLPSFRAMEQLVNGDKKVKRLQSKELDRKAREDFGGIIASDDWKDDLKRDKNGRIYSSASNILHILNNAPGLKGNIRRDDMSRLDVICADLPWREFGIPGASRKWSNDDDAQLIIYMERVYDITGKEKILNAKTVVATNNRFHPVRDYLSGLTWDGTPRLDKLFVDYLGASDDELTRAVTRKALTAAVKRVMESGCKFDYITVLQGPEGIGKSTLLARLGGQWFNDSITDLAGKEGMEQIQGCWIIEAGELQGIKRNEVEGVKAFISRQVDEYRPAYGRIKESLPRQCVFFATTNEGEFLKGDTGNRRFWVVPCQGHAKRVSGITDNDRDQIWAEAKHYYEVGEPLYLNDKLESLMRKRQRDFNELSGDVRQGMIAEYLDKLLPAHWPGMDLQDRRIYLADEARIEADGVNLRQKTCAFEILCECLGERPDEHSRYKAREINAIMDRMPGWQRMRSASRFNIYGMQLGFERTITIDDDDL